MHDREIVAAIVAGNPAGLAAAYDRYAAALYTYCRTLLAEPADAADVVQDTFVIAAPRMSALRDPQRLRSWLYTVARNECLRRLRGLRLQTPLEEVPEVSDEAADVAADVEQAELRALVREALPGVAPAEQEVLDLQVRHGLTGSEVASVLGVSRNHAHALMSRARDQLETALGVLVVARAGRRDCPELNAMLDDWDGRLTVLLRKRLNRHVDRCAICSRRREEEMTPARLLGVAPLIALPLAGALPAGLGDTVMRAVFGNSPAAAAHRAAAGRVPYSFGRHGFPQPVHPLRPPWWQQHLVHYSAAAGTAAAVAAGVTLAVVPHHHPGGHHASGGTSVVADGTSRAPGGTRQPATHGPGAAGVPRADVAATVSPGTAPRGGRPALGPGPGPGAVAARSSPPPPPSAPGPATATASATVAGTLTVSPAELDIPSPGSGSITLTAAGGPVSWSVSEPPGLEKKVAIAPMSGTVAAGQTATLTVTVDGPGKPHVHLTFTPGGAVVTVVVG
jgi:RNA polymerase sigma factor (sigma-70 family)